MSLTAISLLKWARGKFYMNLTHDMFLKHAIKLFWAQKAEMILIAISLLQQAK